MRLKLISIGIAIVLVLMGCQTYNQEGRTNDRDPNVEQTRYNDQTKDRPNTWDRTEDRRDNVERDNRDNRGDRHGETDHQRGTHDNENRYDVSEEAAEKITDEVDEIDYAYVLTTNNNAYVAAVLDNDRDRADGQNNQQDDNRDMNQRDDEGQELTDDVKDEISDIVQSVDNDIDNVFVTTNPDFADLTNNYINDMNEGKPVRGMFDQIGNMIERLFPQNK